MQPGKLGSRRILIWQRRILNKSRNPEANVSAARRDHERPEIKSARIDAPRGVTARIRVREADLEHDGRPQPRALAIRRGPKPPRVLPVQQTQFKWRAHDAVAHARREIRASLAALKQDRAAQADAQGAGANSPCAASTVSRRQIPREAQWQTLPASQERRKRILRRARR